MSADKEGSLRIKGTSVYLVNGVGRKDEDGGYKQYELCSICTQCIFIVFLRNKMWQV